MIARKGYVTHMRYVPYRTSSPCGWLWVSDKRLGGCAGIHIGMMNLAVARPMHPPVHLGCHFLLVSLEVTDLIGRFFAVHVVWAERKKLRSRFPHSVVASLSELFT